MGLGDIVDGVKGGINKGLSVGEDLIDEGKKKVGEGVDYATNKVGDGLDHVGLHGAADAVEDWGDDVASDLGATPGEQQLGQTEEADELVHGSPDKIRESSKHLKDFHTAFDHVSQGMRKVDSSGWAGEGGDAFRKKFGVHPTKWAEASDACDKAAGALDAYADTVKWAQGKAKEAVELYKKGLQASKDAADAYNKKVDAYNARIKANEDPGAKPEPFQDPGKADIKKAHETLTEARKQRNTAASDAQGKVKAALAHAPAEPPPLDRLGNDLVDGYQAYNTELTHVVGGALKGTAGLVNFARGLNPTDPYNLTHPAAYMQNVSMTLSGLVSTAAHPERIVTAAVDGFKKDPSEFVGRLIPELIGTKGAGLARSGLRLGLKTGAKDGLESAVRREARGAAEKEPLGTSRRPGDKTCAKDPVDVATGRMVLPRTDIALPGLLPLEFKRGFESSYRSGGWFGPSWSSTADQRLEIDAEGVVFVGEDGLLLAYPHPAPGVPTLPLHGPLRPLDRTEDGYTLTDPETGRVLHFVDRSEGSALLTEIEDRSGARIGFEYHSASGAPRSIRHSGGYHLQLTTADGRITTLRLAGAAPDGSAETVVRYGYSEDGHLSEVTNSSGLPVRFLYDDAGRITSWTDTNGSHFTYAYDDADRCTYQSGSAGHLRSTFTYEPADAATGHRTTAITDSLGHTSRYVVDARCQVVAEIDPTGSVTRYERDRHHRLLSQTDPLGHTTLFRHDDAGLLISVTRPDGRETRAEYNPLGLPVKVTGPDGNTHRQEYDERGNRVAVIAPAGLVTRFTYDGAGHLATVTDPLGHTTEVRCNAAGLPVETRDPLGAVTVCRRDAFGRPVEITDPTGSTTRLQWTVEGHLARRTSPDGAVESWTYDGEGNCVAHTDPMGGVTGFAYTHFDLLTSRTGPDGVRHTFRHDTELRLTEVSDPQGLSWTYSFDPAGRLVAEKDFDGREVTYSLDAAGRVAARTDALGRTVTFDRNALGQVTRKDAAGRVTTYAYDLTDQLARAEDPDGSLTRLRDRYGRLRTETVHGRELGYAHDKLGRTTGRLTPGGTSSTWTYDAAGNRAGLTTSGHTVDFAYDAAGREIGRVVGGSLFLDNTFDAVGRLTAQTVRTADRKGVQHRRYTYRADGHVTRVDDQLSGSRSFDVTATGRVTEVRAEDWTETYAYDNAGNQTSASWPVFHPGQEAAGARSYRGTRIVRAGDTRYEHDDLGRMVMRQKIRLSRKPETWRYTWDAEDHLSSVTTPDGTVWHYTYDPLGRRTSKSKVVADSGEVVERVDFTWDDSTLCEQVTSTVDSPNRVVLTWDHQGLRPVAQTERITAATAPQSEIDSRFFAVVTDLVGAPTELVDVQGEIAWRSRSSLWGRTTWGRDSTGYTPLRFPGQYYDPETELHYNVHRHYDPETARYLSPDPLGLAPAPNPATYVDNPVTWSDPLGLTPCPPQEKVVETPEVVAPKPLKPHQVMDEWEKFLGEGPYTDVHPRTGLPDADRLVSADGRRSIRLGSHEMNSKPTKFHFHMETWTFVSPTNTWIVDNTMVRVPLGLK
ncbi:putative T7SS-secreted protein [Streptomyces sp. NPDC056949]|uniref:putative T7SS-secreted protein n=1 Tax=Streptomyces sp. NPDC056949 TaxID=3345976 RepID=UPI0036427B7C